jgi:hypothetical protein
MTSPQEQGRTAPRTDKNGAGDARVPAIPEWFKEWGFLPIGAAIAGLTALIAKAGHALGPGTEPFLFFLLITAFGIVWRLEYELRLDKTRAALRLRLYAQSCLEAADLMSGHQFEDYYASMLRSEDWTRVVVIGRKPGGDGGADILATDPRGRDFAIQCKRYALTNPVDIDDVRKLNGALAHEHQGRRGMIVTTGRLTGPAQRLADKSGVKVVARPAIATQMARVRYEVEHKDGPAGTAAASSELV